MKDDIVVNVRLPKKLVAKIDRLADAERRPTRSNMIFVLIEDGIAVREGKSEGKSK
jgi:metal-responsive CopG/Arc/MetJ family transcriptional regulator